MLKQCTCSQKRFLILGIGPGPRLWFLLLPICTCRGTVFSQINHGRFLGVIHKWQFSCCFDKKMQICCSELSIFCYWSFVFINITLLFKINTYSFNFKDILYEQPLKYSVLNNILTTFFESNQIKYISMQLNKMLYQFVAINKQYCNISMLPRLKTTFNTVICSW